MKILAVKLSSFGDLFHPLPAVHQIRQALNAEIHWVANAQYADLVRCFTDVSRVIPFPRDFFFRDLSPFLDDLRRDSYDMIIDFQGLLKSALVARFARGKRRIGPSFHREGSSLFYDEVTGPRNKARHAVEENLDILNHLGMEAAEPVFPIRVPDKPLDAKRPRVAILPGSRWPAKNWPVECYIQVAKRLRQTRDVSLFILGDRASAPDAAHVESALHDDRLANLAGRTTLVEVASLLQEMDLLISNDSGPVHLAAALGIPTLVIFGPTDPSRTGPYGQGHRIARVSLPCQPCFSRTCHRPGIPCLAGVTPEHVAEMAIDMLSKRRQS